MSSSSGGSESDEIDSSSSIPLSAACATQVGEQREEWMMNHESLMVEVGMGGSDVMTSSGAARCLTT